MDRLTLLDMQKRVGSDGRVLAVAEIMNRATPIFMDAPWMMTNKSDSMDTAVTASLPKVDYRRANRGTRISQDVVTQNEESTATFEDYAENDKMVIDSFGSGEMAAQMRAAYSSRHIEAVAQRFAREVFYGNRDGNPDAFDGLLKRYNALTGNVAQNVLNFGGTGADNTSIYVIKWAPMKTMCIYPKRAEGNGKGAVHHENLGEDTAQFTDADSNQRRMQVYRDRFEIAGGLCIADYRNVVRIGGIDVPSLASNSASGTSRLRQALAAAMHRIPTGDGMLRIYMNRTVAQFLDFERLAAVAGAGMTYSEVDGMVVPMFRGAPIRIDDSLLNSEGRVGVAPPSTT